MAGAAAGSPDHDHQTPAQIAGREDAGFAVILTRIRSIEGRSRENLRRIGEIEASLGQSLIVFGRVEGDFHGYCCSYKNWRIKQFRSYSQGRSPMGGYPVDRIE